MIWTWLGALAVGLVLGLLGSGGSILTVPVLVYLAGEPSKLAVAESLGAVAIISTVGAVPFAWRRQVDGRSVLLFGVPGMGGAYGGAALSSFIPGPVQLALFAAVMLAAAVLMLRPPGRSARAAPGAHAWWKVALEGAAVGMLSGLVGVGGGFLIVPALVLLVGLPMRLAVGTSLCIIAIQSISGFAKHLDVVADAGLAIQWWLVLVFGAVGVVGSLIGGRVGQHIEQARLRQLFAVFLLVLGTAILWQNLAAALS